MSLTPDSPLTDLRGVGPKRSAALAEAGFRSVRDLLSHLPWRYEDRSTILPAAEATPGVSATFQGRLTNLSRVRLRRRGMSLVRGVLEDESGSLPVLWFNRPYLVNQVDGDTDYLLHGKVRARNRKKGTQKGTQGDDGGPPELLNPSCEPASDALHSGRVVPVYPGSGDLGPALLRRLLDQVLERIDPAGLSDPLPPELLERHGLPELGESLAALHAPDDGADVAALNAFQSPAHRRLIYGELLEMQMAMVRLRRLQVGHRQQFAYTVDDRVRDVARTLLPFPLTAAQRRCLRQIVDDLRRPHPMLRLLQGDVGSGKTIVAALALVVALESGLQGAFMAPTELLAEQHYARLRELLGERYPLGLLTASNPDADAVRWGLARGEVGLVVGTHALIHEGVEFARLGLAVIDEQHRFGVAQRRVLQEKGGRPDLLVMTATPIPRSLALSAYGDLEVSVLDELPPGRQPVTTAVLPRQRTGAVYRRLAEELRRSGGRAYVVCPVIEASEALDAASVEEVAERVRKAVAPLPCAVLHGRLDAMERERVVADFAAGRVRVLVSTTVIEVGVDVPEATVMIIESGERFGLAQLHQLRGRVGRGTEESRCVVLHGRLSEEGRQRLGVFEATTDGFEIAEADLEIRGPGDLLGTRQSGLARLRVADLVRDREWVERAREDAREWEGRLDGLDELRERVEEIVRRRLEVAS